MPREADGNGARADLLADAQADLLRIATAGSVDDG